MGRVYDAFVRADRGHDDEPRTTTQHASPVTDEAAEHAHGATDASVESFTASDLPAPSTDTERELVERVASLEVAVYALLDRLDREGDAQPLRLGGVSQ